MTAVPRLSVGLPVYNGQNYLSQSLDALLGQSYPDFELIISDNASTDATPEICRRYAATDSRIRYLRQPRNIGAARRSLRVNLISSAAYVSCGLAGAAVGGAAGSVSGAAMGERIGPTASRSAATIVAPPPRRREAPQPARYPLTIGWPTCRMPHHRAMTAAAYSTPKKNQLNMETIAS
jgi:hypothetical protein